MKGLNLMESVKLVCVTLSLALLVSLGCGPDGSPETLEVSGSVTFDGAPVANGEIIFRDAAGQVRGCGGAIANGKYSFVASPGSKKVEITAIREIPGETVEANPGEIIAATEMYIPAKYNEQTTLTAEVSESETVFDFALEGGN